MPPSLNSEVHCGRQLDAGDPSPRGEARQVLDERGMMRALGQVFGDALAHQGKGQLAARDHPIEADDVEAIAGLYGRRGQFTRREVELRVFELGRGVALGELTEAAAG